MTANTKDRLFRIAAVRASTRTSFGPAFAMLPPSAGLAIGLSVVALGLVASALFIVDVPVRTAATGILMPAGGLQDVVAPQVGVVTAVLAQTGTRVSRHQPVLRVADASHGAPGKSDVERRISSLHERRALLARALEESGARAAEQRMSVSRQLALVEERLAIARQRLRDQLARAEGADARLVRVQKLVSAGHLPADRLDEASSTQLGIRLAVSDIEQQIASLKSERERWAAETLAIERDAALRTNERRLRMTELAHDIAVAESARAQAVYAAGSGWIASLLVREGSSVVPGQVVARIAGEGRALEAWLYVPNTTARLLAPGQTAELEFDAWPSAVFGTLRATVLSVSPIALRPDDIVAPVKLPVPAFEVKASIGDTGLAAWGDVWPIAPGTAFRARVLQHRMALWEWLLRRGRAGDGRT